KMAKGRALRGEFHLAPGERPALARHRPVEAPSAAAILVRSGNELAMRVPVRQARAPQRLRLGPDEAIFAISLELAAMAGIDQPVIAPAVAPQDQRIGKRRLHQLRGMARAAICSATAA